MAGRISRIKAPDYTFKEKEYLKRLSSNHAPVRVRMADNQEFDGQIEFFDKTFIRLNRAGGDNLFLFKQEVKYIVELG